MFLSPNDEQTIIEIQKGVFVASAIESFLIDRRAAGLSPSSIEYYSTHLKHFLAFCDANTVKVLQGITPDFLRRYFLAYSEHHNPGGTHGTFRCLRSLFHWIYNEELMPPEWKNPIKKIKPLRLPTEPLAPVSLEDVKGMLETCERGTFIGERDRAILLVLLDTGVRARELCGILLADADTIRGTVMIRYGKGDKTRMAFLGRKTVRAMRAYIRVRPEGAPNFFLSKFHDALTYDGLREMIGRRARLAQLTSRPTLHGFRRAFALSMLRDGADVFSLQRLMGHADLQVMRRYLAQNNDDGLAAHMRASPVDNAL